MKATNDLDSATLRFVTAPLRFPANLSAWEELASIGRSEVQALISMAAEEGVLPEQVLLVQVIHVRPDHVDFGSPAVVRRERHKQLLAADVVQAIGVRDSGKSFFKQAAEDSARGGIVALISKRISKQDFSPLDSRFVSLHLKNPAAIDGVNLSYSPKANDARGDWFLIKRFEDVLDENAAALAAELQQVSAAPEPRFEKHVKDSPMTQSMEILCESDYLRHFAPLVSCGDVLLCAPTIYNLPPNQHEQRLSIGGGGCMFVLAEQPDVALVRRLSLFSHKIIATIWAYQDLVRMAAEKSRAAGAEDAFQMIAHSLGNALNYLPAGSSKVEAIIRVEEANIRAARWLHSAQSPKLVRWGGDERLPMSFAKVLELATFLPEEQFSIKTEDLNGTEVDPRFQALIIELARNLQQHSATKKGEIVVRLAADKRTCAIEIKSDCDYTCAGAIKNALEALKEGRAAERGLTFVWLLAEKLASDEAECIYAVGTDAKRKGRKPWITGTRDDLRLKIHLSVGSGVEEQLSRKKNDRDAGKSFAFHCRFVGILPAGRSTTK